MGKKKISKTKIKNKNKNKNVININIDNSKKSKSVRKESSKSKDHPMQPFVMPSINVQQPAASQDSQLYQLLYKFMDNSKREPSSASLLPTPPTHTPPITTSPITTPPITTPPITTPPITAPPITKPTPISKSTPATPATPTTKPASLPTGLLGQITSGLKNLKKVDESSESLLTSTKPSSTPTTISKPPLPTGLLGQITEGKSKLKKVDDSSESLLTTLPKSLLGQITEGKSKLKKVDFSYEPEIQSVEPLKSNMFMTSGKNVVFDKATERRKSIQPDEDENNSDSGWESESSLGTGLMASVTGQQKANDDVKEIYAEPVEPDAIAVKADFSKSHHIALQKRSEIYNEIKDMNDEDFDKKFIKPKFKEKIKNALNDKGLNLGNASKRETILKMFE